MLNLWVLEEMGLSPGTILFLAELDPLLIGSKDSM
jgi:hypothetical protein